MKSYRVFVAAIMLVLLSTRVAQGQASCVFSGNDATEAKFKRDKGISKYTWNGSAREAKIVTKEGDLIAAKYWACDHYGAHVVMLLGPYPEDDFGGIGEMFARLADRVLDTDEAKTVRDYLRKNPVSLSGDTARINIPNTGYSEYYLRYSIVYDSAVLEIKFYKD